MFETETRDGVAVVRLAHGKVNAFDLEFLEGWTGQLRSLAGDDTTAVVVTGTGSVFSAGVDLRRLTAGGRDYVRAFLPLMAEAFHETLTFQKPLIAAVNGHAVAGGCILACGCDYRVMTDGFGRIGTPELSVGVPFPSVALEILRLTVPAHRLQAVIYQGKTYEPTEALAEGLVDELAPAARLIDRAVEIASRLGRVPAASFALTKRLVRQPATDRLARLQPSIDEDVLAAWMSAPVLDAVGAYVDRTLKK